VRILPNQRNTNHFKRTGAAAPLRLVILSPFGPLPHPLTLRPHSRFSAAGIHPDLILILIT
jgi:hypothetical protein